MAEARSGTGTGSTGGGTAPEWGTERTVDNAPWGLWAAPYGLVVAALLVLWYLIPAGWLWVPLAFVAGLFVSLRTWSEADRRNPTAGAR